MVDIGVPRGLFDQVANVWGTSFLVTSGTLNYNSYNDKTWVASVGGSKFTRGFQSFPTPEELSFLPEGIRRDNLVYFHFQGSGVPIGLEQRVQVSGSSQQFEVVRLLSGAHFLGGTNYVRALATRL